MSAAVVRIDAKKNTMTIEMPITGPYPSSSGKTEVLASTQGTYQSDVTYEGKPLRVNCTVFYKP